MSLRNRLSRTVLIYRPENFDAAVRAFTDTLGITDFGAPFVPPGFGLRLVLSWDAGLEIITPHGDDGHAAQMTRFLEERGEGLYGFVWEVPDLDEGERRAAAAGYGRTQDRLDSLSVEPAWRTRFSLALEAPLPPIAGIEVTLIQIEPARPDR